MRSGVSVGPHQQWVLIISSSRSQVVNSEGHIEAQLGVQLDSCLEEQAIQVEWLSTADNLPRYTRTELVLYVVLDYMCYTVDTAVSQYTRIGLGYVYTFILEYVYLCYW